jgi:ankyrin repeat protein
MDRDKFLMELFTYDKKELCKIMIKAITDKIKNRMILLKTAIQAGLGSKQLDKLLYVATQENDISAVACLINNGANINMKYECTSLLHLSASHGHKYLLQYFIEKKLNIEDKDDFGSTALALAVIVGNVECVQILIKNNANINETDNDNNTILCNNLSVIRDTETEKETEKIKEKKENYLKILQILIDKKQTLEPFELEYVKYLLLDINCDAVKVLVNKFPYIVNIPLIYNKPLLLHAITLNKYDLIDFLLTIKKTNLKKKSEHGYSYIHIMSSLNCLNGINKLLERVPHQKYALCEDGRTSIEHAIIPDNTLNNIKKTENDIIETVKLLVKKGVDINHKNNYGWYAIECAIQFRSEKVVESLINLGANINRKKNNDDYIHPIKNNDLIGFATQNGKLETVKLLLEKEATLHLHVTETNLEIPTPLLIGIINKHVNIVQYLLTNNKINIYINDNTKKYLYDFAIKEFCDDKLLLQLFASTEDVKKLNIDKTYSVKGFLRYISIFLDENKTESEIIIILQKLLLIYCNILEYNGKKRQFNKILSSYDALYDNIFSLDEISLTEKALSILSQKMNDIHVSSLRHCIYVIRKIHYYEKERNTNMLNNNEEITKLIELFSEKDKSIIYELVILIDSIIKYKNEVAQMEIKEKRNIKIKKQKENDIKENVQKLIFKMLWPEKLEQYDYVYNELINNKDECKETMEELQINAITGITSYIPKLNKLSCPTTWFKSYAPNICKTEKMDENHIFSFLLDMKLKNYPCIEKTKNDSIHLGKNASLLLITGKINYLSYKLFYFTFIYK